MYHFISSYMPIALQRPFLFSSVYQVIIIFFFNYLEKSNKELFVKRSEFFAIQRNNTHESYYQLFTFVCLCICSIFDPYTMSIELSKLPEEAPTFLHFMMETTFLMFFIEFALTFLHWLFHWSTFLYENVHKVHHIDRDPSTISTTRLHILEVLFVFVVMYVIPVVLFKPHQFSLFISLMLTSILGSFAHTGLKGWYIAEYHRLHHLDKRYNLCLPILSYFDPTAVKK